MYKICNLETVKGRSKLVNLDVDGTDVNKVWEELISSFAFTAV
jgi:hypothetical protein